MALSDGITLPSWVSMKRSNSKLIEVVDPTGTLKLWLKPELINYAYEDDEDTIVVGYQSEEFKVSKASWDLLLQNMTRSLVE